MIYKLLLILYYLFIHILNNLISMSIGVCFSRGLIRRRCFLRLQWIRIVFKPESWSSGRNHRRSNYRSRRPCSEPRASKSHARKHLYDFMSLLLQCEASTERIVLSLQVFLLVHQASAKCCKSSAGRRGRSNTSRDSDDQLKTYSKLQLRNLNHNSFCTRLQ